MIPMETRLLKLLSNHNVTFYIPPYQRNYEWDTEQCSVFLTDILKTVELNLDGVRTEHFFGTITYFQADTAFGQPDQLVLIDGQQRITTAMLFLVAYRDISDDNGVKQVIERQYLKNENAGDTTEYKIKLKQVESDWPAYKDLILKEVPSAAGRNSTVYRNYIYFRNMLSSLKNEHPVQFRTLIENGLDRFSVITIELKPQQNPWENPQEIFESMNSLGKTLSLADLVRNYLLLGLSPEKQTDLYNRYWLHMETTIPKQLSNFIRDYMQGIDMCSYPKASESNCKDLYRTFKKGYSGRNTESLMHDLAEYSDLYGAIVLGHDSGSAAINRRLSDIRTLGATTTYSFLMMLLYEWKCGKFTGQDISDILDALIVFLLRRRILSLTAPENKIIPTLVQNISELAASKNKRDTMFRILSSHESNFRVPNDIEVSRVLESMNFYNFKLSKFVLSLIEEKLTKSRPDIRSENLQIEHIMPQTLNDDWKAYLGENHEAVHQGFVHNIGNLTLIRHNQELGQKLFSEKKKIYENNAGLQIAKTEIVNKKKWNQASIVNRQRWMTDYLLKEVIPIPDDMRMANNFSAKEKNALSFIELELVGQEIVFSADHTYTARVVSDKEVEFEGKKLRLSPLTRQIFERMGRVTASGSYQGSRYWEYNGVKLVDMM